MHNRMTILKKDTPSRMLTRIDSMWVLPTCYHRIRFSRIYMS